MPIKLFTNLTVYIWNKLYIMSKSKLLASSKYPGLEICTMSSHWKNAVTTCQMAPTGWPIRIIIPYYIFTLKLLFGASMWHLIVSTILFAIIQRRIGPSIAWANINCVYCSSCTRFRWQQLIIVYTGLKIHNKLTTKPHN